jgi:phenylpropionate dioxygenase-like ring-hydroxylating dioxygenase large terminal subunit
MTHAEKSYPLNEAKPYPYEQWWIAAYSQEVGRSLIQRTILDRPVVLYRTEEGDPVALAGLCPHRLYPLVKSRLQGDSIQCGYHGFTFDKSGRCVHIPSQDKVPPRFGVRNYPVVERGGLIWLWTGKESGADPNLLPDLEAMGLGNPDWSVEQHPMTTFNARYQLLIDNLVDLSHVSFIHSNSIPGGGAVVNIPYEIVDTNKSLNVRRLGRDLPCNPLMKFLFPHHEGSVDQNFDAEFFGPNLIRTGGNISASGKSTNADSKSLGITNFIHGITPETPTTVHYYVVTARNFRLYDPAIEAANLSMGLKIQPEDIAALEAIELSVDRFADTRRELSCMADAGAILVRKRLAAQIRREVNEEQTQAAQGALAT